MSVRVPAGRQPASATITRRAPSAPRRRQHRGEARHVGALRKLLVDIAERHPEVVPDRRELARAELSIDRHEAEIRLGERHRDVFRGLHRMDADEGEATLELVAAIAPVGAAQGCRDRVAVEYRQHHRSERVENGLPLSPAVAAKHALDEFRHHDETERIGAPAGVFHSFLEAGFGEQDLGVVPGPGARVLVDSLLRQEGGVLIDEGGERRYIADRRARAEHVEQAHTLCTFEKTSPSPKSYALRQKSKRDISSCNASLWSGGSARRRTSLRSGGSARRRTSLKTKGGQLPTRSPS